MICPGCIVHALQLSENPQDSLKFIKDMNKNWRLLFIKRETSICSFQKIIAQKAHYGRAKSTTAIIASGAKALGYYELIIGMLVDHDPYELTMIVVSLHLTMVVMITTVMVNEPRPLSTAKSSNLHKLV